MFIIEGVGERTVICSLAQVTWKICLMSVPSTVARLSHLAAAVQANVALGDSLVLTQVDEGESRRTPTVPHRV